MNSTLGGDTTAKKCGFSNITQSHRRKEFERQTLTPFFGFKPTGQTDRYASLASEKRRRSRRPNKLKLNDKV